MKLRVCRFVRWSRSCLPIECSIHRMLNWQFSLCGEMRIQKSTPFVPYLKILVCQKWNKGYQFSLILRTLLQTTGLISAFEVSVDSFLLVEARWKMLSGVTFLSPATWWAEFGRNCLLVWILLKFKLSSGFLPLSILLTVYRRSRKCLFSLSATVFKLDFRQLYLIHFSRQGRNRQRSIKGWTFGGKKWLLVPISESCLAENGEIAVG